jgi:hypothetical protein
MNCFNAITYDEEVSGAGKRNRVRSRPDVA